MTTELFTWMESAKTWVTANYPIIIVSAIVLIQWVAFQVLLIHYHFFRKSLVRPKPDGLRFSMIEKNLVFHTEQIELIFEKLAETKKEFTTWAKEDLRKTGVVKAAPTGEKELSHFPSMESTFVSLGELNLKRKLEALKSSSH